MTEDSSGMVVGTMIRQLRDERGITQGQLAEYANVNRSWLSRVELGHIARPERERLERIANYFRVPRETLWAAAGYNVAPQPMPQYRTAEELMAEAMAAIRREREQAVYAVPVEGVASAGPGAYQDDAAYLSRAELQPHLRRLVVTGTCMRGTIEPGDVVIVDIEASYREGQIVAAQRGDQVIVKRFYGEELRGDDGQVEQTADWTIVGLVIRIQRSVE